MNTSAETSRRSLWSRLLLWFTVAMAFSAVVVGYSVYQAFRLSRDAAGLREAAVAAFGGRPEPRVQVTAGPALLTLARLGVRWVPEVPDEARQVLRAVRSASVGVYALNGQPSAANRTTFMGLVERKLSARGLSRVVAVNNGHETVLVYADDRAGRRPLGRFCLAVCQDDQLVIVAGSADAEPMLQLVERHHHFASM